MFSLFPVFNYDFMIHTYFTHIEARRTVIDEVTNYVIHRILTCSTN